MRKSKLEIGRWVRDLRMSHKMKQLDLAHALGFKYSQSIANIESGRAPFPPKCIVAFCKIMNILPTDFIDKLVCNFEQELLQEVKKSQKIKK